MYFFFFSHCYNLLEKYGYLIKDFHYNLSLLKSPELIPVTAIAGLTIKCQKEDFTSLFFFMGEQASPFVWYMARETAEVLGICGSSNQE